MKWIAQLFAVLSLMPFVIFGIVYPIAYGLTRRRPLAFKRAADVTTFFLFPSVMALCNHLWGWNMSLAFLLWTLVAIVGVLAFLSWRMRGDIRLLKIVSSVWRGSFLLLSVSYIVLMTIAIALLV